METELGGNGFDGHTWHDEAEDFAQLKKYNASQGPSWFGKCKVISHFVIRNASSERVILVHRPRTP
jgi:hypothetical protein